MSKFITFMKQNQFWIICGTVAVLMLVSSVFLSSSLSTARKKKESEINSWITQIKNVQGVTAETDDTPVKAHPNSTSADGMKTKITSAGQEALLAWEDRWKSQASLFVWPKDIISDERTYEALRKQPIPERILPDEDKKDKSTSAELTEQEQRVRDMNDATLRIYGKVIHEQLPKIASIISSDWKFGKEKKTKTQALDGRDKTPAKKNEGGVKIDNVVVKWRTDDQQRWYKRVTEFNNPYSINNQPTMMQALYIQQDLWLLEALFKIIKEVNGDADANDLANVKKIDHIFFGKNAIGFQGTLSAPDPGLENPNPPKAKKRKKGQSNNQKKFTEDDSSDPCHGRFVDEKFAPLTSDTVRDAVSSNVLIDNAALTVAKRIPLRVAVIMDERKIPEFLAACANSPFRFEIRQVRVNRHKPGESSGKLDADLASGLGGGLAGKISQAQDAAAEREDEQGEGDGDDGGASAMQRGGGKLGGASAPGASGSKKRTVANRTDFNVKVEFYGIVKIYNPVNKELFAVSTENK